MLRGTVFEVPVWNLKPVPRIELKDEQSVGQMRLLADESYRYRYIIMPMRI